MRLGIGSFESSPTVHENVLYAGAVSGFLCALSLPPLSAYNLSTHWNGQEQSTRPSETSLMDPATFATQQPTATTTTRTTTTTVDNSTFVVSTFLDSDDAEYEENSGPVATASNTTGPITTATSTGTPRASFSGPSDTTRTNSLAFIIPLIIAAIFTLATVMAARTGYWVCSWRTAIVKANPEPTQLTTAVYENSRQVRLADAQGLIAEGDDDDDDDELDGGVCVNLDVADFGAGMRDVGMTSASICAFSACGRDVSMDRSMDMSSVSTLDGSVLGQGSADAARQGSATGQGNTPKAMT